MKLLADQNVEAKTIRLLRESGFITASVDEGSPGIDDEEVLRLAERTKSLLLTNDKDSAELAFLQRKASVGLILLRMPSATSEQKAARIVEVLHSLKNSLHGSMTVIQPTVARRRLLPSLPKGNRE